MIGYRVFCGKTTVVQLSLLLLYIHVLVFGRRIYECVFSFFTVGGFQEAAMLRATVVLPPLELRPRFERETTWI